MFIARNLPMTFNSRDHAVSPGAIHSGSCFQIEIWARGGAFQASITGSVSNHHLVRHQSAAPSPARALLFPFLDANCDTRGADFSVLRTRTGVSLSLAQATAPSSSSGKKASIHYVQSKQE